MRTTGFFGMFLIVAVFCLAAGSTRAQANINVNLPNIGSHVQDISKSIKNIGKLIKPATTANTSSSITSKKTGSSAAAQIEILKREQARLQALIAQLQQRLANATSTAPDLDCVKNAVATRETTISGAYSAMSTCVSGALTSRAGALATAWSISNDRDRNAAINDAWNNFIKTRKNCQTTYKNAVKTAWDAYKSEIKKCRVSNAEGLREGVDVSELSY